MVMWRNFAKSGGVTMGSKPVLSKIGSSQYFMHELPPQGFRPLEASDEELERYGILHRPDPKKSPEAARLWRHVMSRVKTFIQPQFGVNRNRIHWPVQKLRLTPRTSTAAGTGTSENWSGVVAQDEAPYSAVWGTWVIPAVQVPPGKNGDFVSAAWVGLGGFTDLNLFQAGSEHDVSSGGNPNYYMWVEWLTPQTMAPEQPIVNFPVEPGQTVAVAVGVYGDGSGRGYLTCANLETGKAIPFTILSKPDNSIEAPSTTSAEWIAERTTVNGVIGELADYGELNITNAAATSDATAPKATNFLAATDANAITLTMLADDGVTPLSEEVVAQSLHYTFQQTASGQ